MKEIEKLCSFYVNDWHLVTMLLPYINQKINEKANIITILENNLEEKIKIMLSKLNLKNEKQIENINWKKHNINDKKCIVNKMENELKSNAMNIILISGMKNYIENINNIVKSEFKKLSTLLESDNIKIVDCYEVSEFNGNIEEILDCHNKILNTSGEKNIEEVFDGYSKISDAG